MSRRGALGKLRPIAPDCEIAHFRPDDEGCLVAASLACPRCLSGAVGWTLCATEDDARAHCSCQSCGHERDVFLAPEQALRLALHRVVPLDVSVRPRDLLLAM